MSKHFSLEELTRTTQRINGKLIENIPNAEQVRNLEITANGMELVREACGDLPITISSGFRSKALNTHIRGSATSDHLNGWCADFTVKNMSVLHVCQAIWHAGIKFDQMIDEEKVDKKGNIIKWCHISFSPKMRQQWLIMRGGKYTRHGV